VGCEAFNELRTQALEIDPTGGIYDLPMWR
jgi:hypothetical protein